MAAHWIVDTDNTIMFSVIVPIYNHEEFLSQAVWSALRSPLVQEVLLLDDGSVDGSAMFAARLSATHPHRVHDLTPPDGVNRGASHRLNELVDSAEGEWIAVLNSDDVFVGGRFEAIAGDPRLSRSDFVFGNVLLMDERGNLTGAKQGPSGVRLSSPRFDAVDIPDVDRLLDSLFYENYLISTSNMIFRKVLHARVGGFRDYRYVHDWDFALRAVYLGHPCYTPRFLTAYRWHSRNTIREEPARIRCEAQEMFDCFRQDFPETWLRPEFRAGYGTLFPTAVAQGV